MARLIWHKSYSVNINTIDTQHKKLFEFIGVFYDSLKEKKNSEALLKIVQELKKYTIYHFSTEEALMKQYNFIGLKKHKAEHDYFKMKIDSIEDRMKQGKLVLSLSVTDFIEEWIEKHIAVSDKEYSVFLTSRGVK